MGSKGELGGLPVVWSASCLLHEPAGEVWLGQRITGTETPDRAAVILAAVSEAGASVCPPAPHDPAALTAVHEPALIKHLSTIWADWVAAGYPAEYGRDRVVPYVFPTAALLGGQPARLPASPHAQTGLFCYDTMTLVGPGSWEAIRAAADCARSAAGLVFDRQPLAYALCRPPGHHATAAGYGGSCYLNNAAIAAEALRRAGAARVAIADIDAHHGNGTQSIFYDRADVLYASVHVDPGAGWFPHYLGFADERGNGAGLGFTHNLPLAPGAGDDLWLAAVGEMCARIRAYQPDALVLSLGVDAACSDPESPLRVTAAAYREAGGLIGGLGPVAVIQEGGYDLATLGEYVVATLAGLVAAG